MSQPKTEIDIVDWSAVHRSNFESTAFSSTKRTQKEFIPSLPARLGLHTRHWEGRTE